MYNILLIVLLIFIILIVYNNITLLQYVQQDYIPVLTRFDNTHVPLIEPPTEIVIEGNTHECHKTLTPCSTHMDCDVCREGLANCQYFENKTIITITDEDNVERQFTIEPGESYCMALDRERARSCNPNTGVWILAQSPVGFSLLCSCLTPGLVTQLSLYHDCDIPIGCQPHGNIISINERPMRCSCEVGYVADFNAETQTPYCRTRRIRDVIQNPDFFPLAPCSWPYIPIEHPGLDPAYLQSTNARNACVIDPCTVDPITGQQVVGWLVTRYLNDEDKDTQFFCNCSAGHNLFGVYNDQPNMIRPSAEKLVNACIQPFNVHVAQLPAIEYKWFWGQRNLYTSDDDVVATVRPDQISSPRYRRMLFTYLTPHPFFPESVNFMVMKFSTAYTPIFNEADRNYHNLFTHYYELNHRSATCFYPGFGRCVVHDHTNCIRRFGSVQVGTAENLKGTQCYLSRDRWWIRIWYKPQVYTNRRYAVALYVNGLFFVINTRDFRTVRFVSATDLLINQNDLNNSLITLLNTYHHISVV
uniref:Per os infection factor 1 protein n=1 Tax=Spodoptera frugiperda nuclear polyhedrosis virus TaxID=10455 RepID=A0A0R5RHP6_NPVSF|nr:per os infection factor 1 protein [Spodoptera frugiperda multiple nucleopolyhedrovirus]